MKFAQIFANVAPEKAEALAKELAKIVPAMPEAEIDWRVGWGYLVATDEIQIDISIKGTPAIQSESGSDLESSFNHILNFSNQKGLFVLSEGLEHLLKDTLTPYKIGTLVPTLYLTNQMAAVHFSLKAFAKDSVKHIGEEKRKALKEQPTTL